MVCKVKTNRIIKGLSFVLSLLIICSAISSITVFAESKPRIVVSQAEAKKAGDTVDITVSLENNPGIVSATMKVSFDSDALTLKNVKDGGVLGMQYHKPELTSPYTLVWANDTATRNFAVNDTIATLTFAIKDGAEKGKTYPVELTYDYDNYDIYDKDLNLIRFSVNNGQIRIKESGENTESTSTTKLFIGDVNKDGKRNIKDATLIHKYIAHIVNLTDEQLSDADVNKDNDVDVKDASMLQKVLAFIITLD